MAMRVTLLQFVLLLIAGCSCAPSAAIVRAADDVTPIIDLRPQIPGDFFSPAQGPARTLDRLQHDFDLYSWESFVAISWPYDENENADPAQMIGNAKVGDHDDQPDHSAYWETWRSVLLAFPANGSEPDAWDSKKERVVQDEVPLGQGDTARGDEPIYRADGETRTGLTLKDVLADRRYRFVNKLGKMHTWFQDEQALDSGPLVDRNGRYVRYEIVMNRDAYDYIRQNKLYTVEGQQAHIDSGKRFVFPAGEFELADPAKPKMDNSPGVDGHRPVTKDVGAILIKAAWKELTDEEAEGGRFHTRATIVYTPKDPLNNSNTHIFRLVNLGLVGIHIVHKSADVAQWNWSTFEQVDNCPEFADRNRPNRLPGSEGRYSFFDAEQFNSQEPAEAARSLNSPPPRPWNPRMSMAEPVARRAQIVRMIPITADVKYLNDRFHEKLREKNLNSVWQYYQLVSTQWPTRPAGIFATHAERDGDVLKLSPADILGGPAPTLLANAVLETYIQGKTPNASSSCMECHANALSRSGHFSDFTFILERAKHKP
jgi:hypothetical protein